MLSRILTILDPSILFYNLSFLLLVCLLQLEINDGFTLCLKNLLFSGLLETVVCVVSSHAKNEF